ncbi:right-handed parallel beta-helix repeat-containing protein [Flavisolibacter sp. BT320]|nr:right-handed parallel beta-helix repeat-containing protein [Flavisolibacter longurius]
MKTFLTFLAILFVGYAQATNYYFSSSSGDDKRTALQAQHPETPWKTLEKLNLFIGNLKPGDSILFKRGDEFYGHINISVSGTKEDPIVFSNYGFGNLPIITGFTRVTDWTYLGNKIWESASRVSSLETCNMVVVKGQNIPMGRFPNENYLKYESHSGFTSITSNALNEGINWTGSELVIRSNRYNLDRTKIITHTGNKLVFHATSNEPINNFGFFIQNSVNTLDKQNEWFFDPVTKKIKIYSVDRPAETLISTLEILVNPKGNNLAFDGISFSGANSFAFFSGGFRRENVAIRNCTIDFTGKDAINSESLERLILENCNITNSNNCAINLYYLNPYATIKNNKILNTAIHPGMGQMNPSRYTAIFSNEKGLIVQNNTIMNTGYIGINFSGDSALISKNIVDRFSFVLDDGGGIYTWNAFEKAAEFKGQRISENIVLNGVGAGKGTDFEDYFAAEGIYTDDNSANITIYRNTIANCSNSGIFLHNSQKIRIQENICFNNGTQILIKHDDILPHVPVRNITLNNNKFISKTKDQKVFKIESIKNDIDQFGNADSNYYARPIDDAFTFLLRPNSHTNSGNIENLNSWKSVYKKDLNSKGSPKAIREFTINRIQSSNKISNGSFSNNINGVSSWSPSGNFKLYWDKLASMEGGSLKLDYSNSNEEKTYIFINIGELTANKDYILRFNSKGSNQNTNIGTFLRQSNGPYFNLSSTRFISINNSKTDYEILLTSLATEKNACIGFEVGENGTVWIDNIELYEANITRSNPDDFLRLELNATNTSRTIPLNGVFMGIDSALYFNQVTLEPFSSIVLIENKTSIVLPVQFLEFKGEKKETRIELSWKTTSDENSSFFEILRSNDGINFESIGKVASKNTLKKSNYSFTDKSPSSNKNYYRIKHFEKNGKYSLSKTIVIANEGKQLLFQVIPNPATDKINIIFKKEGYERNGIIYIKDMSGNNIKTIRENASADATNIDISNLKSGIYLISIAIGHEVSNQKFLKL